ncbi:MAG: hypothetical protein QXW00_04095 [Candidatus Woesearchaeota archaeon]
MKKLSNSIVSVRIPLSLAQQLERLSKKGHYLNLSEEVKSIVRKRWLEHLNSESRLSEIKNELKAELALELKKK